VLTDSSSVCCWLVGLDGVEIVGVNSELSEVHIRTTSPAPECSECLKTAWTKQHRRVAYVDLPSFGRPIILVWYKRRWRCSNQLCRVGSWTEHDPEIADRGQKLTTRAARWVTRQVGKGGRTVNEVATELGTDWHTVNDTVVAYGAALLEADTDRVGEVTALGLDETLFVRQGRYKTRQWATSVVDVDQGHLLDVVAGRDAAAACGWLNNQPESWLGRIRWAALDMSGPYRKVFDTMLTEATQVVDRFHVIKHANSKVDECRRRVQNQTLGHRGRKDDPLYRVRKALTRAAEKLDFTAVNRLLRLTAIGDSSDQLYFCWRAKEAIRDLYNQPDHTEAKQYLDELIDLFADTGFGPEVNSLAHTLRKWGTQIVNWHKAKISNGPTEAANNLIKRIKRVGFGFRNFTNYRTRVLLYAGKPDWDLLDNIVPPQTR